MPHFVNENNHINVNIKFPEKIVNAKVTSKILFEIVLSSYLYHDKKKIIKISNCYVFMACRYEVLNLFNYNPAILIHGQINCRELERRPGSQIWFMNDEKEHYRA